MKHTKSYLWLLALIIAISFGWVNSSVAQKRVLTYSDVFEYGKSDILGQIPDIEEWLDNEHYLAWMPSGKYRKSKLMKINALSGEASTYVDFSQICEEYSKGMFFVPYESHTADYLNFVLKIDNDLYYLPAGSESPYRLTQTEAEEKNPHISPDGKKVAFTRDHDLYIIDIETGTEKRLTNDGSDTIYNGWASWVYYEEILGRRSRYAAFWWSPDSRMLAFLRFDDSNVPTFPLFHCEGVHGYLEMQRYPKPGDTNPVVKLGVVHIDNKKVIWLDQEEEKDRYVAWPFWSPDSKRLLFQSINRDQDTIHIYNADPFNAKKNIVYSETQSTWVEFFEDLYILKDDKGFIVRSDRDGWRHLYLYDMSGQEITQVTQGEWQVDDIARIDEKNEVIYFHGSTEISTENHLYRVKFNGGDLTKLTGVAGTHNTKVSPDGKYFIDTFNNIDRPTRIDCYQTDGLFIRSIGDQQTAALTDCDLGKVELFSIPTDDGYHLPALWVLPPQFNPGEKYPVIFSVYGGPGRASVSNRFLSLDDHYYAQRGIITIYVDHRGSAHFGKKGEALMHRNLGKWEMYDLIQAVKWLRELPFINLEKIGISGGSYGGYVAAMALTYGADYFTHGIAQYSVTDWQLYDNVYTERYMDQPADNPEGYKFGSVLTHVNNYKGKLLITHGAIDDNVHMQNSIQLVEELQRLNKRFEMMIYPNQRHGIRGKFRAHAVKDAVAFWFRHFLDRELKIDKDE